MVVVVSPWTMTRSGSTRASTSPMATMASPVSPDRLWSSFIRSRSCSGAISKIRSIWSSISRCWAVTQVSTRKAGSRAASLMTGASLMASGLVPKMNSSL